MNSERMTLLLATEAAPYDDAPKLVYADWLEEHGEADRAKWIRDTIAYDPRNYFNGIEEYVDVDPFYRTYTRSFMIFVEHIPLSVEHPIEYAKSVVFRSISLLYYGAEFSKLDRVNADTHSITVRVVYRK